MNVFDRLPDLTRLGTATRWMALGSTTGPRPVGASVRLPRALYARYPKEESWVICREHR